MCLSARLDNTYLPPRNAATAGGSGLQVPNTFGGGKPAGTFTAGKLSILNSKAKKHNDWMERSKSLLKTIFTIFSISQLPVRLLWKVVIFTINVCCNFTIKVVLTV